MEKWAACLFVFANKPSIFVHRYFKKLSAIEKSCFLLSFSEAQTKKIPILL